MAKKTIDDIKVSGKKVLVRCDFNVPMKDGKITNDKRIVAALPTIKKLIADGGKVILCSHLGKPKNGPEEKFSLAPVAVRLSELLGQPVVFANDDTVVGENAKAAVAAMKDGDVVLLQNTRFRKEETKNVEEFSKELASLADCYVDDAFGSCHRAHCSTEGVTKFLSPCVAGYLIGKELAVMGKALENADRPFVAVLGGAKIEDKLNVINNLLEKVDTLIIGGGMAFTFLKAKGYEIGKSLLDETKIDYCKDMMAKAAEKGVQLLLPVDTVCIKDFPNPIDAPVDTVTVDADGAVIEVEIENTRIRGTVQLTKIDRDYPDNKLTGAEFTVYRDSNGNKELDADDALVGTLTESGIGVYELSDLLYGCYFVKETKAPDGFYLDENAYYFEITEDGTTVTVENEAGKGFVNAPQVGSLKIIKTSSDGKVEGFSFRVTGPNGYVGVFTTDKNGEIIIDDLRIGEYVVSEVSDGASSAYVLPPDKTASVYEGAVTKVEMHNELRDTPKTGDDSNPALWFALLGVSAAGAAVLGIVGFRKRRKEDAE